MFLIRAQGAFTVAGSTEIRSIPETLLPYSQWAFRPSKFLDWVPSPVIFDIEDEYKKAAVTVVAAPDTPPLPVVREPSLDATDLGFQGDVESSPPRKLRTRTKKVKPAGPFIRPVAKVPPRKCAINLGTTPDLRNLKAPRNYTPWKEASSIAWNFMRHSIAEQQGQEKRDFCAANGLKIPSPQTEFPWYRPWSYLLGKMFPGEECYSVQSQSSVDLAAPYVSLSLPTEKPSVHFVPNIEADNITMLTDPQLSTTHSDSATAPASPVNDSPLSALTELSDDTVNVEPEEDPDFTANLMEAMQAVTDDDDDGSDTIPDIKGRIDYITWLLLLNAHIPIAILEIKPYSALSSVTERVNAQEQIYRRIRALAHLILRDKTGRLANSIPNPFYAISAFGDRFCVYEVTFSLTSTNFWVTPPLFRPSSQYVPIDEDLPEDTWGGSACGFLGECKLRMVQAAVKAFFDNKFPLGVRHQPKIKPLRESPAGFNRVEGQRGTLQMISSDVDMVTASSEEVVVVERDNDSEYVPTSGSEAGNRAVNSLLSD